jgi:hypothetical protein
MKSDARDRFVYVLAEYACDAIAFVGLGSALSGVAVFGYQVIMWLRDGSWTELELRQIGMVLGSTGPLADPFMPNLLGVQKILIWILDSSLGGSLWFFGVIVMIGSIVLRDRASKAHFST